MDTEGKKIISKFLASYDQNKSIITETVMEKGISDIILDYTYDMEIEDIHQNIINLCKGDWVEISGQIDLPVDFIKRYIHRINFKRYFKYNIYTDKLKFISDYLIERKISHAIVESNPRDYPNIKIRQLII